MSNMSYRSITDKREREKKIVGDMIKIYCRKKHKSKTKLCFECNELHEYAILRSDKCTYMETKTFCNNCNTHCYKTDMRQKIKEVMRFSGPRMIFYHPVVAIRHVIETKKEKKKIEGKNQT